ncbi:MAG TPA: hypothetical protein VF867_19970 [Arthrobacter sp.]
MNTLTLPRHHAGKAVILSDADGNIFEWSDELDHQLLLRDPNYPIVPLAQRTHFDYMFDDDYNKDILAAAMNAEGFYRNLKPLPYAVEAHEEMLDEGFDVEIVTTPYPTSPTCTSEKLACIEEHLGHAWTRRTTMTHDKTRVFGNLLIDDKPHVTGSAIPAWQQIYYGQPYNAPGTGAKDLPRITDWRNWREVIYPALEMQGFNLKKMAWAG